MTPVRDAFRRRLVHVSIRRMKLGWRRIALLSAGLLVAPRPLHPVVELRVPIAGIAGSVACLFGVPYRLD